MTKACENLDPVDLELLAGAPSVALLPPGQVCVDRVSLQPQARRETGDDGDERGSVRFACRDKGERHAASVSESDGGFDYRPEVQGRFP